VHIGSADGHRAWLNGEVVSFDPTEERFRALCDYTNIARASLKRGWNRLLVQVENRFGRWELVVELTDLADRPLRGLTYQLDSPFR